jgi:hypothetical protein
MVKVRAAVSEVSGRRLAVEAGKTGSVVKDGGMALWVEAGVNVSSKGG